MMTQDRMRQSLKRETQAFHFESGEVSKVEFLGAYRGGGSKCLLQKMYRSVCYEKLTSNKALREKACILSNFLPIF